MDTLALSRLIAVATGREEADLVIKNVSVVDVFMKRTILGDVAVCDGKIAGVASHYEGKTTVDGTRKFLIPGLWDAHMHIESTMLTPEEYALTVVPRGVLGVIADPHEITNVVGIEGAEYVANAAKALPLDIRVALPSCVPSTPFETSGAIIDGKATAREIKKDEFIGLAEFMSFPNVLGCDPDTLLKIAGAQAAGKPVDGHAPGLTGAALNGYAACGILSDHESLSAGEMQEKISCGIKAILREGSATKNMWSHVSAVTPDTVSEFLICTDDRTANDLVHQGGVDNSVREAIRDGISPIYAITMATINIARTWGLKGKGAIAPGYDADMVLVSDLKDLAALKVWKGGTLVAEDGKPLFKVTPSLPSCVLGTCHVKKVDADDFKMTLKGHKAYAMYIVPTGALNLEKVVTLAKTKDDVVLDGVDVAKVCVVERHFASGAIGKAFIQGYGIKKGAIAFSVGHDSHNITVIGKDNASMALAVNELARIGGGMALAHDGKVESFALDIAGLMSSLPAKDVAAAVAKITQDAYEELGISHDYEAFMNMGFLSLAVIPNVRVTDKGYFDVRTFSLKSYDAPEDAE